MSSTLPVAGSAGLNRFEQKLAENQLTLRRANLDILQVNVGRKCNQACRHCHVDAAPWRTEMIAETTARRIGEWIQRHRPATVDLTGGAPELSEWFTYFVTTARNAGLHVIDRCNLTIIEEKGFDWLPAYLAENGVEVIASLPCYSAANVNQQRGNGVFEKSILALHRLNSAGYGTHLPLHLVYNPLGANLPGPQAELEADYKEALQRDFGIVFHRLLTITNQPIARFAEDLRQRGQWDAYLELLANSFNPGTVAGLMCRNTLSVDYNGAIYDCDFNQMLGMNMRQGDVAVEALNGSTVEADHDRLLHRLNGSAELLHLWDVTPAQLEQREILTGQHCLACTAGAGSSCGGALT